MSIRKIIACGALAATLATGMTAPASAHGWGHHRHHGSRVIIIGGTSYYAYEPYPYYYYPYPAYYPYAPVVVPAAPLQQAAQPVMPPPQQEEASDEYCREYQSVITVGGRAKKTYGTACMQPDGSWQIMN